MLANGHTGATGGQETHISISICDAFWLFSCFSRAFCRIERLFSSSSFGLKNALAEATETGVKTESGTRNVFCRLFSSFSSASFKVIDLATGMSTLEAGTTELGKPMSDLEI